MADPGLLRGRQRSDRDCRIEISKVFSNFKCDSRGLSAPHDLATADVYHTGFLPFQFMKKLDLYWVTDDVFDVNEPLRDPQYWPQTPTRPAWNLCFNSLSQVRLKAHCKMRMQILGEDSV
jgi:hypothetical protein